MRRSPSRAWAVPLVVLTVACAGEPVAIDFDSPAPLEALPPCGDPPEPSDDPPVEGLVVPESTVVTEVQEGDPIVTVTGYIPMTPIAIRLHYEERDDLELHVIEDEVFEAEALVSDGTHRTYIKANAVCAEGSRLLAVVASELDAEGLPVPDGTPDPVPGLDGG